MLHTNIPLNWNDRLLKRALSSLTALCLLLGTSPTMADDPGYQNLNTSELQSLIKQQKDLILLDVRAPYELTTLGGSIDAGYRSYNLNRGNLELRIDEFVADKNQAIVVFCGINDRSPYAAKTLTDMGYTRVYNYADGFFKWRDAGLPVKLQDEYPGSMLFRKPVEVAPDIWSAIGATAPPTYENSGHNNNLSFIVSNDGVMVVNAGASYLLAQALHAEIKAITDQPVKYVSLENGQGHAMLGSSYWQDQGAKIIAHVDTAEEIKTKGHNALESGKTLLRDKSMGTRLTKVDIIFNERHVIQLGERDIELMNLGPAHSPGDILLWLPQEKIVIAGDIAFHQRLLPVFENTDTAAWLNTWKKFKALNAKMVIPGHGAATNMHEVEKYTYGYLSYLRDAVAQLIDADGSLEDAYKIDQSSYAHLDTYDELAKINAGRVFRAMEFE